MKYGGRVCPPYFYTFFFIIISKSTTGQVACSTANACKSSYDGCSNCAGTCNGKTCMIDCSGQCNAYSCSNNCVTNSCDTGCIVSGGSCKTSCYASSCTYNSVSYGDTSSRCHGTCIGSCILKASAYSDSGCTPGVNCKNYCISILCKSSYCSASCTGLAIKN